MTDSTTTPGQYPNDIHATPSHDQGPGPGETPETPGETPHFETSDVEANLAMEQGLGVGARELAAQRDPGGIVTPDEDDIDADDDAIDRDTAVQGDPSI
jgi:hypothetical protein